MDEQTSVAFMRSDAPKVNHLLRSPLNSERRFTPWLVGSALLLFVLYRLRNALIPFVIAGGLAYVAGPAIRWVRHRLNTPRWLAAIVIYLAYLVILAAIGWAIVRAAGPQISHVTNHLPEILHHFLRRLFHGEELSLFGLRITAQQASDDLLANHGRFMLNPGNALQTAAIGISALMGMVLTIVLLGYFMIDGPRLSRGVLWLVPPRHRSEASRLAARVVPVIGNYLRGMLVIMLYAIVLTWLITAVALRLHGALMLAVVVGLLELIPVMGPIVSTGIIGLIAIQQMTWGGVMGIAIFATVLRISIDQFVGPMVLSRAARIPPPVIIFSFIAGGVLFGALGILIAIPVAAAIKVVLGDIYDSTIESSLNEPLSAS